MSIPTKQKLAFLAMLIIACTLTHFAYSTINPGWIIYKSAMLQFEKKNYAEATVLFEKSIALGLHNPSAYKAIAEAYFKMKNYPKAIHWLEIYLQSKPKDLWARKALAGAYLSNGQLDKAEEQDKKILELVK